MATSPKPPAPKPVKGWAILDPEGFCQMVSACDSDKFIWRKFTKPVSGMAKLLEFSQADYEKVGYRAIRVTITPCKP